MVIIVRYADIISGLIQYAFKVLPEVRRQEKAVLTAKNMCIPHQAFPDPDNQESQYDQLDPHTLICCLFALFHASDIKNTIHFILSLHTLRNILESYRSKKNTTEEGEIRALFGCLACAADPSRSSTCAFVLSPESISTSASSQICLSDQCRLQLAILPSYKQVALKIKKYMQLYIDLQSYRHYPAPLSKEILKNWCSAYLMRYPEISEWEFCAAADSFVGIAAMFAAASIPGITNEEASLLDEACFPWLSGLSSLLNEAIRARSADSADSLNFTCFYRNLKECEERILFFEEKAEKACLKLKNHDQYIRLIKTMTSIYLTDSEADFGMLRLATANILKKTSSPAYILPCRLMRLFKLF